MSPVFRCGTTAPDVSVLIAAYRAGNVLPRAVGAAMASLGVTVEVIVVDDASGDETFATAQRLAGPVVRVAQLPRNGGPSVARNAALKIARGEWVAVLDADDAIAPDRLARMVRLGQGADVVLGNMTQVDGRGRCLGPFLPPKGLPDRLTTAEFVRGNLRAAGGHSLGYLKPLIRRGFLAQHKVVYDPTLRNGEDYHLILSCLLAGATCRVDPVPGYIYTRAPGSVSHRIALDHLAALIAAEDRLLGRVQGQPALAALIRQRRQGLANLLTTETVLRALKAGHLWRAAKALSSHPAAAAMVVRQATEGMRQRFSQTP